MPEDVEQIGQVPDVGTEQAQGSTTEQSDEAKAKSDIELKKVREEAASNRVKARELEAKLAAIEAAAAKTEAERETLNAQVMKLQAQAIAREAVPDALYADLVAKNINIEAAIVDGKISDEKIREQITDFRSKYPAMFRGQASDAAGKAPAQEMNWAEMTMEEYARARNK